MSKGNCRPDYSRSIVNLTSALARLLGYECHHNPLRNRHLDEVYDADTVVFIILDGLGQNYLDQQDSDLALKKGNIDTLSSVFPPSTGSAITSFYTGVFPLQHGITGWYVYLARYGLVSRFLPFTSLVNSQPMDADISELILAPPWIPKANGNRTVVVSKDIWDSNYTRYVSGNASRVGYSNLEDFFVKLRRLTTATSNKNFVFAYWSALDTIAHLKGIESEDAKKHLLDFDRHLSSFIDDIPSNTRVLITSDHGLVDVKPEKAICIGNHSELSEALIGPVCGDTRAGYFYVRPDRVTQFEDYIDDNLSAIASFWTRQEALNQGLFGVGKMPDDFPTRIGDYIAVMDSGYALFNSFSNGGSPSLIGNHGGLTEDELHVPLVLL